MSDSVSFTSNNYVKETRSDHLCLEFKLTLEEQIFKSATTGIKKAGKVCRNQQDFRTVVTRKFRILGPTTKLDTPLIDNVVSKI